MDDHFARDADELDSEFLDQVESSRLGRIQHLSRGEVLHWQGDPVECVFVVRTGSLKEYTLLPDGRAYAYRVLSTGGLAGATAYLLGHDHDTITQALDEVQVIALQLSEFDRLLDENPRFPDETHALARSIQGMAASLRGLVEHVQSTGDRVSRAAHELTRSAEHVSVSNGEISSTVSDLAASVAEQQKLLHDANCLIHEIASTIERNADAAREA